MTESEEEKKPSTTFNFLNLSAHISSDIKDLNERNVPCEMREIRGF